MRGRSVAVAGLALAIAALVPALEGRGPRLGAQGTDASCRVCHPTAVAGLRASDHRGLLEGADTRDHSCRVCHGDLTAHSKSAARPGERAFVQPAAVAAAACKSCHEDADYAPSQGTHPWHKEPAVSLPPPADRAQEEARLDEIARHAEGSDFDWSGLIALGYRFVHVTGSRARYETDINLDAGMRLHELEVQGLGGEAGFADLVRVTADDIGDPWERVDARVEKRGSYSTGASFEKNIVKYLAAGDFHRVDKKSKEVDVDLSVDVTDDLSVFGAFSRRTQDGFWLTNRIGTQNVTPQNTISGVESPRQLDAELVEAGVNGRVGETAYTVTFEYWSDQLQSLWTFDQPSAINPAFSDREDFDSRTTLRGPGVRAALRRSFGPLNLDFDGLYRQLDRRVVGGGVRAGYDIDEYVTTTDSFSEGGAETWLLDFTADLEISDDVILVGDLRWLDHQEEMDILQTDVTVFPSLGTSTTVTTNLDQRTVQRKLDGSVELEVSPTEGLNLNAGWGFSREELELPDLDTADSDFVSGTFANDGGIFGFQWRPDSQWKLSGRYENFGQNGVQLHPIVEDRGQRVEGRLGWQNGATRIDTFVKYRRAENETSRHHNQHASAGLSAGFSDADGNDLFASYVYTDIDTETLTNFYFDPDPNPVPTFVGFVGQTHTVAANLLWLPGEIVRCGLTGGYTVTNGSFDIALLDWRADVAVEVWERGELGIEFRQVDYDEQGQIDDYHADLVFVYWRQRIGGRR